MLVDDESPISQRKALFFIPNSYTVYTGDMKPLYIHLCCRDPSEKPRVLPSETCHICPFATAGAALTRENTHRDHSLPALHSSKVYKKSSRRNPASVREGLPDPQSCQGVSHDAFRRDRSRASVRVMHSCEERANMKRGCPSPERFLGRYVEGRYQCLAIPRRSEVTVRLSAVSVRCLINIVVVSFIACGGLSCSLTDENSWTRDGTTDFVAHSVARYAWLWVVFVDARFIFRPFYMYVKVFLD